MNIQTAIKNSIAEQDKVVALKCCHRGWDGAITQDTIAQGVMERYRAMGLQDKVEGGVAFVRSGLNEVKLVKKTSFNIELDVIRFHNGYITGDENLFHPKEIQQIGKWMQKNFHH